MPAKAKSDRRNDRHVLLYQNDRPMNKKSQNGPALDLIDRKILAALRDDGRLTTQALAEIVDTSQGQPILCFYSYRHDCERILRKFKGAKKLESADDIRDWNDGKIPLLLAHPAGAGHGLNLQTGGNIIVWFGLTWSLELYQQANARLYRQGQKNSVIIHHLVTDGTVDKRVLDSLQGKREVQDELLESLKEKYGV